MSSIPLSFEEKERILLSNLPKHDIDSLIWLWGMADMFYKEQGKSEYKHIKAKIREELKSRGV